MFWAAGAARCSLPLADCRGQGTSGVRGALCSEVTGKDQDLDRGREAFTHGFLRSFSPARPPGGWPRSSALGRGACE